MTCQCLAACSIPGCTDTIIIGQITPNEDVYVLFAEVITGRRKMIEVTSDANGYLIADTTEIKEFFSPSFLYEIKVLSTDNNECQTVAFTVSGQAVDCVSITFTDMTAELAVIELQDGEEPTITLLRSGRSYLTSNGKYLISQ